MKGEIRFGRNGQAKFSGGFMPHEWVFEVLKDLRSYAVRNGLRDLAASVEETLAVAELEISAAPENGTTAKPLPLQGSDWTQ